MVEKHSKIFNNDRKKMDENETKMIHNKYKKFKLDIKSLANEMLKYCTSDEEELIEIYDSDNESTKSKELILKKISTLKSADKNYELKCRCTHKSVLKNHVGNNAFRFFIDLKDESGSIRLLGFNKKDDEYYEKFKVNDLYKITNASVKQINSKFNNVGSKYELRFNENTRVLKLNKEQSSIKKVECQFIYICDLLNKKKNDTLLCIIKKITDLRRVKNPFKNDMSPLKMISLIDSSNCSINCSLWNNLVSK